ncbi:EamA family transporter [bacterium]|nr:EamA family transporter [bacterium]
MASDNLRGSLWMIGSMAGFAAEDGFLKAAAGAMPVGEVLVIEGLAGILCFASLALRAGSPPVPRAVLSGTMAARSTVELIGRLFYALAIALTPLSTASAILQATPLVVVPGAALLFRERVGGFRWAMMAAGFAAVLVIVRPGLAGFSALSLLALAGMLGFAGRDLATRAAPPALSNAQLGVAGFAVLALSGMVILSVTGGIVLPGPRASGLVLSASAFGIAGYGALTQAMRTGEVSAVTPFRYARLLFALVIGVLAFGERPDVLTLLGSAVIVACGLALLMRRRIA